MDSFFFSFCTVAITFVTLLGTIFFMFYRKFRFYQENKAQASSSCSLAVSSPPSSLSKNRKHYVFPSFHEADVKETFHTDYLKRFRRNRISHNEIERTKSMGLEHIEAIRESRIAIVLLSRNYVSSSWCLNELVEIMKCRVELGQIVMIIYYEVDPTDVKKQIGTFGKVFNKTCKGKTKEVIMRWRKALEDMATIDGCHSSNWNNEALVMEKIASDVSKIINNSTPSRNFAGFDEMRAHHMGGTELLLRLDLDEMRMIGIFSRFGIGRTTISRFLFYHLSSSFMLSVFMENIKNLMEVRPVCFDDYSAKLHLQKPIMRFNYCTEFISKLYMPYSELHKLWEGNQPLGSLTSIDLDNSRNLKELPDLSTATNLKKLNLASCTSLVELPWSIGKATNLYWFNLYGYTSLVRLPSSIGNATNLKVLLLMMCTSLVELPSSIKNLHKLKILNLKGCSKLEVFPININFESVGRIDLTNCPRLTIFTENSSNINHFMLVKTTLEKVSSRSSYGLVYVTWRCGNEKNLCRWTWETASRHHHYVSILK